MENAKTVAIRAILEALASDAIMKRIEELDVDKSAEAKEEARRIIAKLSNVMLPEIRKEIR